MNETEKRIFNLRRELAKHLWAARSLTLDCIAANENTRDLVSMFPNELIKEADLLQHKAMAMVVKVYGKRRLTEKGIANDDVAIPAIKSRTYLPAVKLAAGFAC